VKRHKKKTKNNNTFKKVRSNKPLESKKQNLAKQQHNWNQNIHPSILEH
jgi:hypothetical protein